MSNLAKHYLGDSIMAHSADGTAGAVGTYSINSSRQEITIGSCIDIQITRARQEVERLCILKAKFETLNVLEHPAALYNEVHDFR